MKMQLANDTAWSLSPSGNTRSIAYRSIIKKMLCLLLGGYHDPNPSPPLSSLKDIDSKYPPHSLFAVAVLVHWYGRNMSCCASIWRVISRVKARNLLPPPSNQYSNLFEFLAVFSQI